MADYYNLDLEFIKNDIKNFVASNSTLLEDYNYEGSAISNMINVLAYVTQYNMYYLNTVTKELFLSSAKISSNIHRLANMLNYIPKRNVSPSCDVLVSNNTNNNKYIYFGSEFYSGDITMTYMGDVVTVPPNSSTTLSLNQGEIVEQQWISDGSPFQTFQLSDKQEVDNTYLYVGVSQDDLNFEYDWININNQNPVVGGKYYYIEYLDQMSIKFDDGSLYQIPKTNQIVSVRYLKTNGDVYGNTVMIDEEAQSEIDGISGVCVSNFSNGELAETDDQIKSRAILNYTTQNRAITESDYNVLFSRYDGYSEYKAYKFFGGEKIYIDVNGNEIEYSSGSSWEDVGFVYMVGLKNSDNIYEFEYLTETDKTSIETFYHPYKVITLFFKFKNPVVVYFNPTFRIKLKSSVNFDSVEFKSRVDEYLAETYTGFDKTISRSNIVKYIDGLQEVNYSDVEYDFFAKINKETATYSTFSLHDDITDLSGTIFELSTISEQIPTGSTFVYGENTGRILDNNFHEKNTTGLFSVYLNDSSTFAVGNVIDILDDTGATLATCTISEINNIYINTASTMSDVYLSDSSTVSIIGSVNCETGFVKLDNFESTVLNDMTTFAVSFTLVDDISYTGQIEIFTCPELSTINYIG
ncbi:MAG: hypothetical protein RBT49_02240 [Bacteroidales bacterium]|jgi:hypothetical protein|nr:hypothetical protein [Bacteroidales bacterium]